METCSAAHPRCARHGRAPCSLPQITGPLREEPNHHHLNTSTTTTTRSPPFPLRRSLQTLDPLPRRRYAVRGDPARRRGCRPYRRSSGASAPTESSGDAARRPCPTRPSARSTTSRLRSAPPPPPSAHRYAGPPAAPPLSPPRDSPSPPPPMSTPTRRWQWRGLSTVGLPRSWSTWRSPCRCRPRGWCTTDCPLALLPARVQRR
jgi:hypothetical protein